MILSTWGGLPQCMLGYHPPGPDTPPQEQTPPAQSMLGDTVNTRAVRILLECNLVIQILLLKFGLSFYIGERIVKMLVTKKGDVK